MHSFKTRVIDIQSPTLVTRVNLREENKDDGQRQKQNKVVHKVLKHSQRIQQTIISLHPCVQEEEKKLWTQRRRLGNISNLIFRLITVNYLMQKGKSLLGFDSHVTARLQHVFVAPPNTTGLYHRHVWSHVQAFSTHNVVATVNISRHKESREGLCRGCRHTGVKLCENLLEMNKSYAGTLREGARESWASAAPPRLQTELILNEGGRECWREAEPDGY